MTGYCKEIIAHYSSNWSNTPKVKTWGKGPVVDLPDGFCVLEFPPTAAREMWTYATCCMSHLSHLVSVELHLFSPNQSDLHVELLTAVSHYNRTGNAIGVGHTVNFGRPWIEGSSCEYGLVSLPYLDGPSVQNCRVSLGNRVVQCLWLIPITESECKYKRTYGLDALEEKLDQSGFNYLDPLRSAVVQ